MSIFSAMGLDISAFELVIENCDFKDGLFVSGNERTLVKIFTVSGAPACFGSAAESA
jgi:hypothetical protein